MAINITPKGDCEVKDSGAFGGRYGLDRNKPRQPAFTLVATGRACPQLCRLCDSLIQPGEIDEIDDVHPAPAFGIKLLASCRISCLQNTFVF
jgi:hypothetical protein